MFDIFSKIVEGPIYSKSKLFFETELYASTIPAATIAGTSNNSGLAGSFGLANPITDPSSLQKWMDYFENLPEALKTHFFLDGTLVDPKKTTEALTQGKGDEALSTAIAYSRDLRTRSSQGFSGPNLKDCRVSGDSFEAYSCSVDKLMGPASGEPPSFSMQALKSDLSGLKGEDEVKGFLLKGKTRIYELKKALRDPKLGAEIRSAFKQHGVEDVDSLIKQIKQENPGPFRRAANAVSDWLPLGKGKKREASLKSLSLDKPEEAASNILSSKPERQLERAKHYLQRLYQDPAIQNPEELAEKFIGSLKTSPKALSQSRIQELDEYRKDLAREIKSLADNGRASEAKLKPPPPKAKPEQPPKPEQ
jgi:hypothetical protein